MKFHTAVDISQQTFVDATHRKSMYTTAQLAFIQLHMHGNTDRNSLLVLTKGIVIPHDIRKNGIFFSRFGQNKFRHGARKERGFIYLYPQFTIVIRALYTYGNARF